MQTNAHLVDLEKMLKMSIYIILLAEIGVDIAENEPDVEVRSNGLLALLLLSPSDARRAALGRLVRGAVLEGARGHRHPACKPLLG